MDFSSWFLFDDLKKSEKSVQAEWSAHMSMGQPYTQN